MEGVPHNPASNVLGPSVNEAGLVRAIETSGYPLQGAVAGKLKDRFGVTEEWGYIDRDTKEHRSLDVFAFKALGAGSDVHPRLALLVECKRSVHPYVFFRNVVDRQIPGFPRVTGLTLTSTALQEVGGRRSQEFPAAELLGLADLPFVSPGPPRCSAFAKAVLQGEKANVSGADPFRALILPLIKATDYAASLYGAGDRPKQLFPTLILGLGVLDAPMMVVSSPSQVSRPVLTPWARVSRQEAHRERRRVKNVHYVVDVVHIGFLDEFVSDHFLPFVEAFSNRAREQSPVLFNGGVVADLGSWHWDEIRPVVRG